MSSQWYGTKKTGTGEQVLSGMDKDNGSRGMGSKWYGTKITETGEQVLSGMEQR